MTALRRSLSFDSNQPMLFDLGELPPVVAKTGGRQPTEKGFDLSRATEEQRCATELPIVPGDLVLFEARAGTGKTTTLEILTRVHSEKKFLYLVFNKANAAEARRRMPSHVESRSTHSLAFASCGRRYVARRGGELKLGELRTFDICRLMNLSAPEDATEVMGLINQFLQSNAVSFDELGDDTEPAILSKAKKLWERMVDPDDIEAKISHDGYLKLWSLEKPVISGYDAILVDEAQDTSAVVLKVMLEQCRLKTAAVIFVGDSGQAIYGWRGATNAMEICSQEANFKCSLTESFRFGPKIAARASRLLGLCEGVACNIHGCGPGPVPAVQSSALIARTNARLITHAAAHEGKMHFAATTREQKFSPFIPYKFQEALDVYFLYSGQRHQVRSPYIKRFFSSDELEKFAYGFDPSLGERIILDAELAGLIDLVQRYGSTLPEIIDRLCRQATGPSPEVKSFTTAHRAKGLEWSCTELADDFLPIQDGMAMAKWRDRHTIRELKEEIRLLYVAITRARIEAKLPAMLEDWFERVPATVGLEKI